MMDKRTIIQTDSPFIIDVKQTKHEATVAYKANSAVTENAESVVYLIPTIPNPPDWYLDIQYHIDESKSSAKIWLDQYCPNVQNVEFAIVVAFNESLQDKGSQILNTLSAIELQPKQLSTALQRQQILDNYDYLDNVINEQIVAANKVREQLNQYHQQLVLQNLTAANDLNIVGQHFQNGQEWITQINGYLKSDYLQSKMITPCSATVAFKESINVKIEGTGSSTEIIYASYGSVFLCALSQYLEQSQLALQVLQNFWGTIQTKLQAVKTNLDNSQGQEFTSIIKSLELQIAIEQWQQLVLFVQHLTTPMYTN